MSKLRGEDGYSVSELIMRGWTNLRLDEIKDGVIKKDTYRIFHIEEIPSITKCSNYQLRS